MGHCGFQVKKQLEPVLIGLDLALIACRRASVTPFNLTLRVWMESRLPKYTGRSTSPKVKKSGG